jgi:hypothetical protein
MSGYLVAVAFESTAPRYPMAADPATSPASAADWMIELDCLFVEKLSRQMIATTQINDRMIMETHTSFNQTATLLCFRHAMMVAANYIVMHSSDTIYKTSENFLFLTRNL